MVECVRLIWMWSFQKWRVSNKRTNEEVVGQKGEGKSQRSQMQMQTLLNTPRPTRRMWLGGLWLDPPPPRSGSLPSGLSNAWHRARLQRVGALREVHEAQHGGVPVPGGELPGAVVQHEGVGEVHDDDGVGAVAV